MTIQPIVEGFGEVQALPVLLRRLRDVSGAFGLEFAPPIRGRRFELSDETSLRRLIRRALAQRRLSGLLVLFDSDDDCPRDLALRLQARASEEAGGVPCTVVIAHREYEAWFLASLRSLRGSRGIREDAEAHPDPESVRGAKERLTGCMEPGRTYSETRDQAALSALFDLAAAYRSCRSFRRMVRAFGIVAVGAGASLQEWPPPSWIARE